jgi:phosphoribosylglycinamide formyltransferase 1
MPKANLVVLISGSGSNLQAIIDATENGYLDAEIKAVISNRAEAYGLERAREAGIETHIIRHQDYPDRVSFDQALIDIIDAYTPDLVILAGFMRILSPQFIRQYRHRLLNIHPSLLPRYKGLNTHQRAIDDNAETHGASVHYVNDELDSGQVVVQAEVEVKAEDTADMLAARVLEQEHQIYPLAIGLHIDGAIRFSGDKLVYNGQPLDHPLRWENGQLRVT